MAKPAAIGIDVSSKQFHVARHGHATVQVFENSLHGRRALIKAIRRNRGPISVALESTGPYGLALAIGLHKVRRIDVRYINPGAAKGYASRGLVRSKTDRVDAHALARMAHDRVGDPWQPPSEHALNMRSWARRIRTLVNDRTREKNRLQSTEATGVLPAELLADIENSIASLDERIAGLRYRLVEYARQDHQVSDRMDLLCSIKGIAEVTAVEILAELGCMPADLTARQLVAQAGLDPRSNQSGDRDRPRHISKMGSRYLRATLHMAALNTVRWVPEIQEFHRVLTKDRNKAQLVAYVAVARKLLHTIHGMLRTETHFDPSRFYQPKRNSSGT
ncbi:MAG: IS110 family transposase [Myxococcota bacterium]